MADRTDPPRDGGPRDRRDVVEEPWRGRVMVRLRRHGREAGWLTLQISSDGDQLHIEWEPLRGAASSHQVARAEISAWLRAGGDRKPLATGDVEWLNDCELVVRIEGTRHDTLPVEALPALLAVAVR